MVSPGSPFTLTGGRQSPVYVDCRRLLSFPQQRDALVADAAAAITACERRRGAAFTAFAGGETAGIAFAALMAMRMGRKMIYVRKETKSFGRRSRIEGMLSAGDDVLLIEDMATDGASKISFINAIRQEKARCDSCFVWFFYDLPGARQRLRQEEIALINLATWEDLFAVADWGIAVVDVINTFLGRNISDAGQEEGALPQQ